MHHNQQGPYGPGMGQEPGTNGPGMHYHHWSGSPGPGFAYGPPPGAYGPGPAWGAYPPGFGAAQGMGPEPAMAGVQDAMNEFADQSGLGALKGFLNFNDSEFWKGALVGAAIVLLMTNEDLRGALLGGAARTANAMKAGLDGAGEDAAGAAATQDTGPAAEKEHGE